MILPFKLFYLMVLLRLQFILLEKAALQHLVIFN